LTLQFAGVNPASKFSGGAISVTFGSQVTFADSLL